jgi:hypothetical protein
VGGSLRRHRSVIRTQPMSTERAPVTSARVPSHVPTTSSVDPPPRSVTTNGPSSGSRSPTAPVNDSRASSFPEMTSASTPSSSLVMAKNSSRLVASRVAEVATMRTRSAPLRRQIFV